MSTAGTVAAIEAAGVALATKVASLEATLLESESGAAREAQELREHGFEVAELEAELADWERSDVARMRRVWVALAVWAAFALFGAPAFISWRERRRGVGAEAALTRVEEEPRARSRLDAPVASC